MQTTDHLSEEQADDFALGALSDVAGAAVSLHLAVCEACRARVAASERVLVQMALGAPRRKASHRLRRRVLEDTGIRPARGLRRLVGFLPVAAALGALVVAAGAFAGLVSLRSDIDQLQANNADLRVQIADTEAYKVEILALTQRVDTSQVRVAELLQMSHEDRELMAVLLARDPEVYDVLPANDLDGGAVGRIVWDEPNSRVWLIAAGLEVLPADQTYQLWVNAGGKYRSLGTFRPDADGYVRYFGYLDDVANYDSAVVTVERAGGSPERRGESRFVSLIRLAQR